MASRIKVPRFILLSALGADDPQGPAEDYLYHKREAEDYLKNSGLSYTIIRPGHLIHGGPSGKINMQENMQWIVNVDISCGDIALVLKSILDSGKLINKIVEITSGENSIKKPYMAYRKASFFLGQFHNKFLTIRQIITFSKSIKSLCYSSNTI